MRDGRVDEGPRMQAVTLELADGSERLVEEPAAAPVELALRAIRAAEAVGMRVAAVRLCGIRAPRAESWTLVGAIHPD